MSDVTIWVSQAMDGDIGAYDFDRATGRFAEHPGGAMRHPADTVVMPMALSWERRARGAEAEVASASSATPSATPTATPTAAAAETLRSEGALLLAATRGDRRSIVAYRVAHESRSNASGRADASTTAMQDGVLTRLAPLAQAPIASSLAYLEIDPSARTAIGASYGENRVSVYAVDDLLAANPANPADPASAAGDVAGPAATLDEVAPRQVIDGVAHAHAVVVSRDGRHVYVSALGADAIWCFTLGEGRLRCDAIVQTASGFGPRHMRLSADDGLLHVLSEFQGVVASYARASETGALTQVATSAPSPALSGLVPGRPRPNFSDPQPDDMARWIWAADLQLTPDDRFLYLTERTSSRIVVHASDGAGGWVPVSWIDTETQPRGIAIDATGRYLFACGERSAYLSAYRIDPATGALHLCDRRSAGNGANWITIAA